MLLHALIATVTTVFANPTVNDYVLVKNIKVCPESSRIPLPCGNCGPGWGDLTACEDQCNARGNCDYITFFGKAMVRMVSHIYQCLPKSCFSSKMYWQMTTVVASTMPVISSSRQRRTTLAWTRKCTTAPTPSLFQFPPPESLCMQDSPLTRQVVFLDVRFCFELEHASYLVLYGILERRPTELNSYHSNTS